MDKKSQRTIEDWARDKQTPDWVLAAIRVNRGWAIGKELEEFEFDHAAEEIGNIRISSEHVPFSAEKPKTEGEH